MISLFELLDYSCEVDISIYVLFEMIEAFHVAKLLLHFQYGSFYPVDKDTIAAQSLCIPASSDIKFKEQLL